VLLAIGDLVEDILVVLAGPPILGTDNDCHIVRSRGGSAANAAVAAAELGSSPAWGTTSWGRS
jgi:sugar/nucleoside kinase (ribokinase family)